MTVKATITICKVTYYKNKRKRKVYLHALNQTLRRCCWEICLLNFTDKGRSYKRPFQKFKFWCMLAHGLCWKGCGEAREAPGEYNWRMLSFAGWPCPVIPLHFIPAWCQHRIRSDRAQDGCGWLELTGERLRVHGDSLVYHGLPGTGVRWPFQLDHLLLLSPEGTFLTLLLWEIPLSFPLENLWAFVF